MAEEESTLEVDDLDVPDCGGGQRRLSQKSILLVLGSIVFAIASLVLALEFFVVERIPPLTEPGLSNAQKLWQEHGPVSYDIEIELRGARPGSVQVNVRNRVVVAETRDGRVPPEHTWDTWTVPGMFNTIELDMGTAEDPEQTIGAPPGTRWQLQCEFDPILGIPRRYHRMVSAGPEVYWRVTKFEAR